MGGQSKPVSASDDDFGDFNDGSSGKSAADPLSNLISLDSLTMNKNNVDCSSTLLVDVINCVN